MARRGGKNVIRNPSTETNTSFWNVTAGAAITRDTAELLFGAASLRVDLPITNAAACYQFIDMTGVTTTGVPHTIACKTRLKAPAGQVISRLQLRVQYSDATVATSVIDNIVATGAWQEVVLPTYATDPTKTLTSSTAFYVALNNGAIAAPCSVWIDGVDVRIDEPDVDDYIDGSLGAGYAWTGAAHGSTSTRAAINDPYVPAPSNRAGTNWMPNPSAETATTSVAANGGVALSVTSEAAVVGSASLKAVTSPTVAQSGPAFQSVATPMGTSAGSHYVTARARFWLAAGIAPPTVVLRAIYTTATGGNADQITTPVATPGAGAWQTVQLTALVTDPAKAIQAIQVQLLSGPTARSIVIYVDAVDIRIDEPDCDDYIDGSLGSRYAWTGAANNSASTRSLVTVPIPRDPWAIGAGWNRCTNPSAEVSTANLTTRLGATVAVSTEAAWVGAQSFKVVIDPQAGSAVRWPCDLTGLDLTIPHKVRAKVRMWLAAGQQLDAVRLMETVTAFGATTEFVTVAFLAGTGGWQEVLLEGTTKASSPTTAILLQIDMGTSLSGRLLYVDGVDIRIDEQLDEEYIDGDQTSRYSWTGTAGLSSSKRAAVEGPLFPLVSPNPDAPWRDGPLLDQIEISRVGGGDPRLIRSTGLSVSWPVIEQGQLSAEVATKDLMQIFGVFDLRGRWIRWEHPTLGVWAGIIVDVEHDDGTQTTELAAKDFSALLSAMALVKIYTVTASPAAGLAKRVVRDANREGSGYGWITAFYGEEMGPPVTLTLRGGKVEAALRTIANQSGDEWWVDDQRILRWWQKRGRDLTGRVQLVTGRHVIGMRYTLDLEPVVNDLLAVPADEQYALSQAFRVDNDASIRAIGRRQDQINYTGFVTESTLRPLAEKDLKRLLNMGKTIQFDVVNVDGCYAWFREGDTVALLAPAVNVRLAARVMVRTFDSDRGVLTVSADAEVM
jgi:hypothetical protein